MWLKGREAPFEMINSSLFGQRFMDDWQEDAVSDATSLAYEFTFASPWPNPFNPATQLAFTLPRAGHASLTVYDVLGREVARLVDSRLDAGRHTVTWDATGSPAASGTCFCRLESDGQVAVQKRVLLKASATRPTGPKVCDRRGRRCYIHDRATCDQQRADPALGDPVNYWNEPDIHLSEYIPHREKNRTNKDPAKGR